MDASVVAAAASATDVVDADAADAATIAGGIASGIVASSVSCACFAFIVVAGAI